MFKKSGLSCKIDYDLPGRIHRVRKAAEDLKSIEGGKCRQRMRPQNGANKPQRGGQRNRRLSWK